MLLHLSPAEARTVRDALSARREEHESVRDGINSTPAERELANLRIELVDDVLTKILERIRQEDSLARGGR